jgi:hypothetical protein
MRSRSLRSCTSSVRGGTVAAQPWYPFARGPAFRQGPLDQARLEDFLTAVGQLDVPPTSAAHLDAAPGVGEAIKRAGRESR